MRRKRTRWRQRPEPGWRGSFSYSGCVANEMVFFDARRSAIMARGIRQSRQRSNPVMLPFEGIGAAPASLPLGRKGASTASTQPSVVMQKQSRWSGVHRKTLRCLQPSTRRHHSAVPPIQRFREQGKAGRRLRQPNRLGSQVANQQITGAGALVFISAFAGRRLGFKAHGAANHLLRRRTQQAVPTTAAHRHCEEQAKKHGEPAVSHHMVRWHRAPNIQIFFHEGARDAQADLRSALLHDATPNRWSWYFASISRTHASFSKYQRTLRRSPEAKVSCGAQPSSRSILLQSIA